MFGGHILSSALLLGALGLSVDSRRIQIVGNTRIFVGDGTVQGTESSEDIAEPWTLLQKLNNTVTLTGPLLDCKSGECTICKTVAGKTACLIADAGSGSMSLRLKIGFYTLISGQITSDSPDPICVHNVPTKPEVTEVCLVPSKVSLEKMAACVKVTAVVSGHKQEADAGCFTIPKATPLTVEHKSLSDILQYLAENTHQDPSDD